jgi:predicted component of type VI protein secretion system
MAELTRRCASRCRSYWPVAPNADIELQDKVLDAILEQVGGWKVQRYVRRTWPSSPTST